MEQRQLLFGTGIHTDLTRDALSFVALSVVDDMNGEQYEQDTLGQFSQANHFDGSHFQEAAANIETWYEDALSELYLATALANCRDTNLRDPSQAVELANNALRWSPPEYTGGKFLE